MKRLPIGILGLVGALATAFGGVAVGQPATRPSFVQAVNQHFDGWDQDHDGELSAAEIDAKCLDPEVKGVEAAAVAAIKRVVRSQRFELPALTKSYLTTPAGARDTGRGGPRPDEADGEGSGEPDQSPTVPDRKPGASPPREPNWQGAYRQGLLRVERSDRQLFGSADTPTIDHCHQGPLGDCYFVSVMGAAVARDSAAVKLMITPVPAEEGGGYRVTFGTGRTVMVTPLTDAEVAISSTTLDRTGDGGLWLAVAEKAFGTMRLEDRPDRYDTDAATDAIAHGGSTRATIRLLTGHTTEAIMLRRKAQASEPPEAKPPAEAGTPGPSGAKSQPPRMPRRAGTPPGPSLVLAGDPEELAARVRTAVSQGLAQKRLVTVGTGDEKLPPGIDPRHAYAVLAFNAEKDTLTIWNPHGNTFPGRGRTMGEPGLENGYPTKAGIFAVPVADVLKIFRGVIIETDEAAEKK